MPPVIEALGERSLLLMFDEANRLAEKVEAGDLPHDIFDYLRALIQQTKWVTSFFSLATALKPIPKVHPSHSRSTANQLP